MLRFLFTTTAVLALALPVTAQDAEVGEEYDITLETEEDNQYTGPYGQARIGSIVVNVPNAKVEERYHVRIHRHKGEPVLWRQTSILRVRAG